MKAIDLSHLIFEDMTLYPGTEKPSIIPQHNIKEDGFRESKISMFSHVGTHIDAPAHMLESGKFLSDYEVDKFIGKAMVIAIPEGNSGVIDIEEIKGYKDKIEKVDFVVFNTGWHKYWGTEEYFKGYPVLNKEAVQWLTTLKLKGIGIDAISIDAMDSEEFYGHNTLLKSDFIIIENLTNLNEIPVETFTLSVLPLKYSKADGSPVRAVAIF